VGGGVWGVGGGAGNCAGWLAGGRGTGGALLFASARAPLPTPCPSPLALITRRSPSHDATPSHPLILSFSPTLHAHTHPHSFPPPKKADPWNWNLYLFPLWAGGVLLRHAVLFPLRLALLLGGFTAFAVAFFVVTPLATARNPARAATWQRALVRFMCQIFVASWTAVVRYHGPKPAPRPGHVWVANHTSMIDYMILCAYTPFAAIMQLHPGWVGFLQTRALSCLGCLWFNRTEVRDRALVAQRMRDHVSSSEASPLLIFPEGTCVNNRYCVMFKRGAFDLGARVCPIAIRYDPVFVDAFWNSKRQSFTSHLLALMTSWAVVCDVYFLEPQARGDGETAAAFAERVQRMVATRAGLAVAPWDGYLKYYNLAAKHPDLVEKRRAMFAARLRAVLPGGGGGGGGGEEGRAGGVAGAVAGGEWG